MTSGRSFGLLLAVAVFSAVVLPAVASESLRTARVSKSGDGAQGDNRSETPALSADGTTVAFSSIASNLVPGDTNRSASMPGPNGGRDVFVTDVASGTIERVSVRSDGSQSGTNSASDAPALSADGRFVAFHSTAGLDSTDFNGKDDVFVHDRETGTTERVSLPTAGGSSNGDSAYPAISADGRFVAFYSYASNLVEGDTNRATDIFVRDRQSGTTERVSTASDGTQSDGYSLFPALSADGRSVTFVSQATNLVAHEVLGIFDVYVHDRDTGETEHVSVTSNETIGNEISYFSSVSGDGRYVAFDSTANNLVPGDGNDASDVFIRDREHDLTTRISVTSFGEELDGHSFHPSISEDGRFVSFTSEGTDVVDDVLTTTRNVYVHDRLSGTTSLVSRSLQGGEPNGPTETDTALHTMSDDGLRVAMSSAASDLVPGDTNGVKDVFTTESQKHFGITSFTAAPEDGKIDVSVDVRATGVPLVDVADDPADGADGSDGVGGEITGARLVFRPVMDDVLATLRLQPPPGAPMYVRMYPNTQNIRPPLPGGTAGIVHELGFTVAGNEYEVRALPVAASGNPPSTPFFGLFRCDPACLQVATLRGGHTTTGTEVVVAIPLDLVGASADSEFSQQRVSTGVGDAAGGAVVELDEAPLPNVTLPSWKVSFGMAPAGTPREEVDFDTDSVDGDSGFTASLPTSSLGAGDYDVWSKACLAQLCSTASRTVTLEGQDPSDPIATILQFDVHGHGSNRVLQARLSPTGAPDAGIAGRTIDFYANGELIGSATTNDDGVATLTAPPRHRGGKHLFEATFAGDDSYLGSNAQVQT